jgi:hypothetical protein
MADWAYQPQYDARWQGTLPPTLVSKLSDGKTIRRQKHTATGKTWDEEYWFTGAEHDAAYAIFIAKGRLLSFTKLSWDIYGTPAQERTVYFASDWQVARSGLDFFTVSLTFELAL